MAKVGFLVMVVGAALTTMACGSAGQGTEETTSQAAQEMCAVNNPNCAANGYPTGTGAGGGGFVPKPIGRCVDGPGLSYGTYTAATGNGAGWEPYNPGDNVWSFEDYIVSKGYVNATDAVYNLAPVSGSAGHRWFGLKLGEVTYAGESADTEVTQYFASLAPVNAHVVQCAYTATTNDVDTGDYETTTTVTYWSVHDPGGCTSGGCRSSHTES